MNTTICPECGEKLNTVVGKCVCGWTSKRTINTEASPEKYRCSYKAGDQQCPMPGTVSKSLYGQGRWFCSKHMWVVKNILSDKRGR